MDQRGGAQVRVEIDAEGGEAEYDVVRIVGGGGRFVEVAADDRVGVEGV